MTLSRGLGAVTGAGSASALLAIGGRFRERLRLRKRIHLSTFHLRAMQDDNTEAPTLSTPSAEAPDKNGEENGRRPLQLGRITEA